MTNRDETLYGWISARIARLSCAHAMQEFTCEYAERDEPEVGYPGIPRCYLSGNDEAEWCGPCQKRNQLYQSLRPLREKERRAFRRLCRAAQRFKRASDGESS